MFKRTLMTALAFSGVAYAQQTPPSLAAAAARLSPERLVYEAAFFAQFSPSTAADMVERVPGFSLDSGEEQRRGYSGAVGNVLIDGVRPSAKTDPISSILARIPAEQVVRIEVLRGAEVAGDASGQSVLVNIVRTPLAGAGVYDVNFEYSGQNQDRIVPHGDISYNGRNGLVEWGASFRLRAQNRELVGERLFFDGAGVPEGRALIRNPRNLWDPYYNANLALPLLGGRLRANAMINPDWFNTQENHFRFRDAADAPAGALDTRSKEEGTLSEIGLNYDRDVGAWALALVGLRTQHPFQYHEDAVNTDASGAVTLRSAIHQNRESTETILRGALSRTLNARNTLQFGGEGALNTLDSVFSLTTDDGAGPTAVIIPNANISVEEKRADLFAVHVWRPAPRWSLETRLGWETSTLTFTGDANQETELSFWKPSLQLTRSFGASNQLRLRYYRDVGQLDFDDFVSAASISDNLINGGNPDLVPQTDWRAEMGGDLRFPGGAALDFALVHHDLSNVNDLVPITASAPNPNEDPNVPGDEFVEVTFDAPGNLREAEAWSIELKLTAKLPVLPNARLTVEAELWDTDVTDPVTGAPRIVSWQPESEVEISFRQDFKAGRWSWGVEYEQQGEVQGYRLSEIDTQEEGPWVDLWWETTALPHKMKLRLWAANIANGEILRDRRFYTGDRNGPLIAQQLTMREFTTAPWAIVEISGSF